MIITIGKVGIIINSKLGSIISIIVIAFVTWRISDALLEILYESIDASIQSSPDNVSSLLLALRTIVGLLAFDAISFVIVAFGAIASIYKAMKD